MIRGRSLFEGRRRGWHWETAKQLIDRGYRVISRRFKTVARIDRPDWMYKGPNGQETWDDNMDPDYFRRVLSRDVIERVPRGLIDVIPNSSHDWVGYVAPLHARWDYWCAHSGDCGIDMRGFALTVKALELQEIYWRMSN